MMTPEQEDKSYKALLIFVFTCATVGGLIMFLL